MPVYFFRAADGTGPVKIGWAIEPKKRLSDVQRMSPVRLCLLTTVEGGRNLEAELHRTYRQFRLWGEWFKADRELMAFIGSNMAPPPPAPLPPEQPKAEPKPVVQVEDPELWTLEKVGRWLNYSVKDIKWLIEEHGLAGTWKNDQLFVRDSDLASWLESMSPKGQREKTRLTKFFDNGERFPLPNIENGKGQPV